MKKKKKASPKGMIVRSAGIEVGRFNIKTGKFTWTKTPEEAEKEINNS